MRFDNRRTFAMTQKPSFFSLDGGITNDGKKIDAEIRDIKSSHGKLADKIHNCAISCVLHAMTHGDVTKADKLLAAVPDWRTNRVRNWLLEFGPFTWSVVKGTFMKDDEKQKVLLKQHGDKPEEFAKTLKGTPITKENPDYLQSFELIEAMKKLLRKAERVRTGKVEVKEQDLTGLNEFQKLVTELSNANSSKSAEDAADENEGEPLADGEIVAHREDKAARVPVLQEAAH
jgi:hypothetical protein